MKKTMIIALLAVLVLGVFTACNGDVNAELAGGKRVITFEIDTDQRNKYSFGNDTYTKVINVPSDCKTLGDLVDRCSFNVELVGTAYYIDFTLKAYETDKVRFEDDSYYFASFHSKELNYPSANEIIIIGGTYELYISHYY